MSEISHRVEWVYAEREVRAIDATLIAAAGGAPYLLMQRAASAALEHLRSLWPAARSLLIVCGPGNNGGDGWALARLAIQAGLEATVLCLRTDFERGSAEARRARSDYRGAWIALEDGSQAARTALAAADLVVDAVFGLGLTRAPSGPYAELIEAIGDCHRPVFALDLPSGLQANTGHAPGAAVHAAASLMFVAAKPGLFTGRGRALAGRRALASLADPAKSLRACAPHAPLARVVDRGHLAGLLPPRARDAHKGDSGHVLVLGGDSGMAGASLLCARSALRSGAGLVSLGTRQAHAAALVAAQPECMVRAVEDAAALQPLLQHASVCVLGPGLGQAEWGQCVFESALQSASARVLDADALNLLAQSPRPLPGAVLTPHPGEAARLLGITVGAVQADRFSALDALVERYQACVVLKGAGSLVGAPGELPVLVDAGNPGMAVGGMGDVLAGVIAALRAQGLSAFEAAWGGALLHACAGDAAAGDGERGLLPSDLLPWLRRLLNCSSESVQ